MLTVVCDLCQQRPSSVHLTEARPGAAAEVLHICHHCLLEQHLDLDSSLPAISELQKTAGPDADAVPDTPALLSTSSCRHCGMTPMEFNETQRFGCRHDVDHFGELVVPLLERLHNASHHVGRSPASSAGRSERAIHRRVLYEKQLAQAVAEEDYERAARLRDRLREFEE